jgi:hypothetical protein
VREPKTRVPHLRALDLQPGDGAADLAQERGPVDLLLDLLDIQVLQRARDGAERGEILPDGPGVEAP